MVKETKVLRSILLCAGGKAGPVILLLLCLPLFAHTSQKVKIHNFKHYYKNIGVPGNGVQESKGSRLCGLSQLRDATRGLEQPRGLYGSVHNRSGLDKPGELRTFTAIDFTKEKPTVRDVVARLVRHGVHAYIYVDTSETWRGADLDTLIDLFDFQIYPTNTEVFGAEPNPGIDGDSLITILLYPMAEEQNDSGHIAGTFWPVNQFPKKRFPNSNERELLYLDVTRLNQFGARDVAGTLAHQFQHLIHWNHDPNEEAWINEGLSEYAIFRNNLGWGNDPAFFLDQPDHTLMRWSNRPADYARAFLWILYLLDHYGGDALARDIVADSKTGIAGLQEVINLRVSGLTFDEIFTNWAVANCLGAIVDDSSLLSYPSLKLPRQRFTHAFGRFVGHQTVERVHAYAADYYQIPRRTGLVISLDCIGNAPELQARLIRIASNMEPQIEDFPLDERGKGSLTISSFAPAYDKVVLMTYSTQESAAHPFSEYELDIRKPGSRAVFVDTLQYYDKLSKTIMAGLSLPSQVGSSEKLSSFAVRLTPRSDGVLSGAEIAVWKQQGRGGALRVFVYDDSLGFPAHKIDSVDVVMSAVKPGVINWNLADFSDKHISLTKGEDFHIAWELVDASAEDTVFAILDTARIPTDRSSVFSEERLSWAKLDVGCNLWVKAMVIIPEDLTVPRFATRIWNNPDKPDYLDFFLQSEAPLNPLSVAGQLALADSIVHLDFHSLSDSNTVFEFPEFKLFASGTASLIIGAEHEYGTVRGQDSLQFHVDFIASQKGGRISSADGKLRLSLPADALVQDGYFATVALGDNYQFGVDPTSLLPRDLTSTGLGYSVTPDHVTFKKMADLAFYYDRNDLALLSETDLAVAYLEKDRWVVLGGELYRDNKSISVLVNRTGSYSLVVKSFKNRDQENAIPNRFHLEQNYPNPFNPSTTIVFGLPTSLHTTLRIINLKGQVIATLLDDTLPAGEHRVEWDSTDEQKSPVASGVYLYQIIAGDYSATKKLVLVR
ncbi:MAG: T9SS type A sorting domain-containing protein [bacterium]